jgi:hypothetical protein
MLPIRAKVVWIGGSPLWEKQYQIRFMQAVATSGGGRITWQPRVLDAGFRRAGTGDRATAILDPVTMQPVQQPVPLNGAGEPLTKAELNSTGGVYGIFWAYRLLPFAPLNLVY